MLTLSNSVVPTLFWTVEESYNAIIDITMVKCHSNLSGQIFFHTREIFFSIYGGLSFIIFQIYPWYTGIIRFSRSYDNSNWKTYGFMENRKHRFWSCGLFYCNSRFLNERILDVGGGGASHTLFTRKKNCSFTFRIEHKTNIMLKWYQYI